jgi:hypothetical protein
MLTNEKLIALVTIAILTILVTTPILSATNEMAQTRDAVVNTP